MKTSNKFIFALALILILGVNACRSDSGKPQDQPAEESARRALLNDTVQPFRTPEFAPTPRASTPPP